MIIRTGLACVLAAVIMTAGVTARAWETHESAQSFVHTASIANKFEIESSQLALKKSHDPRIRDFAKRMVNDHTKIGQRLKETLRVSHSHIHAATRLDAQHQDMIETLRDKSDGAFDREYVRMQTEAHKQAVNLFSDYAKEGTNVTIKAFAGRTLPILEDHLNLVEHLKASSY